MMSYDFVNKIFQGHVLDVIKKFPSECVDMIMFSPPYYSLRTYGSEAETVWGGNSGCEHIWENCSNTVKHEVGSENTVNGEKKITLEKSSVFCIKCNAWKGQLGLEPTWEMYVEHLKQVCCELKRVLKKTGSMYIVIGDSYVGSLQGYGAKKISKMGLQNITDEYRVSNIMRPPSSYPQYPYKRKCLMCIPWRVAFALIDDGWILRNAIIWHKPNALPTSARDRFKTAYEYILFFVKSQKYYFNLDNIRVPHKTRPRNSGNISNFKYVKAGFHSNSLHSNKYSLKGKNPEDIIDSEGDFWKICTRPFKEKHFAVYPIDVCVRPIIASCPPDGIVLDPFCGSGTTFVVCEMINHGEWDKFRIFVSEDAKKINWNLKWCGIEINPNYIEIARKRLEPYSKQKTLFENC